MSNSCISDSLLEFLKPRQDWPLESPHDLLLLAREVLGRDSPAKPVARLQSLPIGRNRRTKLPGKPILCASSSAYPTEISAAVNRPAQSISLLATAASTPRSRPKNHFA